MIDLIDPTEPGSMEYLLDRVDADVIMKTRADGLVGQYRRGLLGPRALHRALGDLISQTAMRHEGKVTERTVTVEIRQRGGVRHTYNVATTSDESDAVWLAEIQRHARLEYGHDAVMFVSPILKRDMVQ